jgi:hypothetical protein
MGHKTVALERRPREITDYLYLKELEIRYLYKIISRRISLKRRAVGKGGEWKKVPLAENNLDNSVLQPISKIRRRRSRNLI